MMKCKTRLTKKIEQILPTIFPHSVCYQPAKCYKHYDTYYWANFHSNVCLRRHILFTRRRLEAKSTSKLARKVVSQVCSQSKWTVEFEDSRRPLHQPTLRNYFQKLYLVNFPSLPAVWSPIRIIKMAAKLAK